MVRIYIHNRFIIIFLLIILSFVYFKYYYTHKKEYTKKIDYTIKSVLTEKSLERVAVIFPSFDSPFDSLAKGLEYSNQIDTNSHFRILFFSFNFNANCSEAKMRKEANDILKNLKADKVKKVIFLGDTALSYLDPREFDESYFVGINPNYINRNTETNLFKKSFIIDKDKSNRMSEFNKIRQLFSNNFIKINNAVVITENSGYRLPVENNTLSDLRKFYAEIGMELEECEVSSSEDIEKKIEELNQSKERLFIIVTVKRFSDLNNNDIGFRNDALELIYKLNTRNLIFSSYYSDVKKGLCQISLGLNYFDLGSNIYKLIKGDEKTILDTPYIFTMSIRGFNKINLKKIYRENKDFIQFIGEKNDKRHR